jgi:hypothetical protein
MMSTTKRPPDIRTSYTRIERALLAAYLGNHGPAPVCLFGTGAVDEETVERWADEIWGHDDDPDDDDIEDEDDEDEAAEEEL